MSHQSREGVNDSGIGSLSVNGIEAVVSFSIRVIEPRKQNFQVAKIAATVVRDQVIWIIAAQNSYRNGPMMRPDTERLAEVAISGFAGGSTFIKYVRPRPSLMRKPGVTPSAFTATTVKGG
jgi:hypothetical protein